MATPRKHWFRVADSLAHEPLTNDQLAALIRLMALLNTRWARNGLPPEEACRITLGPAEVMLISGKRRRDVALKSLRSLADFASMSIESHGEVVEIIWPKWAIFQDLRAPEPSRERPGNAPSAPAPARRPRKTHTERPEGASRPSRSGSPPSAKSLCPERLDDEQRSALVSWAKAKGFTESECRWAFNVVKDWSHGKGERRADWVATTRNAMRDGWGLKGYRESDAERYQREMAESPFRVLAGGSDDAA